MLISPGVDPIGPRCHLGILGRKDLMDGQRLLGPEFVGGRQGLRGRVPSEEIEALRRISSTSFSRRFFMRSRLSSLTVTIPMPPPPD